MRRMDKITGRSDDMLIIRGVNVFPSQIEEQVCAIEGLAPHYLIEINKQGNLDTVTVRVESDPRQSTQSEEQLIKLLSHKIKNFIGISATIVIATPQQLPRSEGKAKRVIDHRI
jgi:phenylacetate-CoA ligase